MYLFLNHFFNCVITYTHSIMFRVIQMAHKHILRCRLKCKQTVSSKFKIHRNRVWVMINTTVQLTNKVKFNIHWIHNTARTQRQSIWYVNNQTQAFGHISRILFSEKAFLKCNLRKATFICLKIKCEWRIWNTNDLWLFQYKDI